MKKEKSNRVKIIWVKAYGHLFENLTPDSIHEIITPPVGEPHRKGEWVMGNGSPVRLLPDEFEYC